MRSESTSADAVDRYLAGGSRQVRGWLQPAAGLAVDVFEEQEHNVDGSGRGDRLALERNLSRHGVTQGSTVKTADSRAVSGADLIEWAGGSFRVFSVAGGHTGWRCTVAPFLAAPHMIVRRQSARARRTDQIREWGKRVPGSAPAVRRFRKGVRK